MKRLMWLLAVAVTGCQASVRYPAANLADDSYQAGEQWQLVWADEFDKAELNDANWSRRVAKAGRFNAEWQRYTDDESNAYIDNGCLVIKAIHEGESHGENRYTSARLETAQKQSWRYGKVAARIQLPYGQGIWPAFWMVGINGKRHGGDTRWPFCGEIDIMELWGSKDDGAVEATIHYADRNSKHAWIHPQTFKLPAGRFADAFHVFEIEWDEQQIRWMVDGQLYATQPITADEFGEFHQEFFILLNIAVGGKDPDFRPDERSVFPQYMYVDWVRVYQQGKS
ncbi:Beta-glucanase [Pontiella desulfatans]|uniref:Beta-glucanase n=1 Tax=Pontiella desulfatans TaxID=2750659 RepID=A0A6C2TZK7_PONDE|nr:glycoside hydrolase family 16 protein [Pontiella desulfatans]VGO13102.1 Beta-glucanase [Pontiella desulfatans]